MTYFTDSDVDGIIVQACLNKITEAVSEFHLLVLKMHNKSISDREAEETLKHCLILITSMTLTLMELGGIDVATLDQIRAITRDTLKEMRAEAKRNLQ